MKQSDKDVIVSFLGVLLVFGIIGGMSYAQYTDTHKPMMEQTQQAVRG
jgi:CHASE3 domain sensor protein